MSSKNNNPALCADLRDYSSPVGRMFTGVMDSILGADLHIKYRKEREIYFISCLAYSGFFMTIVSAVLLALGDFLTGGVVLVCSLLADLCKGAFIKRRFMRNPYLEVRDAAFDRYEEMLLIGGLVFYFYSAGIHNFAIIALFYLLGAYSTPYIRAKIEMYGFDCKKGYIQRLERVLGIVLVTLLGAVSTDFVFWGILLIAFGANLTALQRLMYGRVVLKDMKS